MSPQGGEPMESINAISRRAHMRDLTVPRQRHHSYLAPAGTRNRTILTMTKCYRAAGNLFAFRDFALATSAARSFGAVVVSSEERRRDDAAAISSTAVAKAPSFAFEGLWKPLIFRTYCNDAARISSAVTGGSKLKSSLMLRHIVLKASRGHAHTSTIFAPRANQLMG